MNKYVIIFTFSLLMGLGMSSQVGFEYKDYKEVMKGFLLGIGVQDKYLDHLLSCLTDQKDVEVRFIETIDKIDRLDFNNLPLTAELFADLYDIIIMSVVEIDLCANENEEYDVLFRRIYNLMYATIVKRLMLNFISNHQQIFKDIQDMVDNYHGQKFKQLGTDLGDIMHLVLIYKTTGFALEDYIKLIKGLLKGLNVDHDVDKILKCVDKVPDVMDEIAKAIEIIKNLDINNINEIVISAIRIFMSVKKAFEDISICADTVSDIKVIIEKLSNLDIEKIVERVSKDMFRFVFEILAAENAWEQKDYESFGDHIGAIIYCIFLISEGNTE